MDQNRPYSAEGKLIIFDKLHKIVLREFCKIRIRNDTIEYCKVKAKLQKQELQRLVSIVEQSENELNSNICNTVCKKCYCENKEKLEKYYSHKTKEAIIRSRVQWYEEVERNTKYFTGLEKRKSVQKCITELKTKNGKGVTCVNTILRGGT